MKRGIIELTPDTSQQLIKHINREHFSKSLQERFSTFTLPTTQPTVSLFLSEEEVESILDSLSTDHMKENSRVVDLYNSLHTFLLELRST